MKRDHSHKWLRARLEETMNDCKWLLVTASSHTGTDYKWLNMTTLQNKLNKNYGIWNKKS